MSQTESKHQRLWAAAFLSMAAGLVFTGLNAREYLSYTSTAKEYIGYLEQLQTVEHEARRHAQIRDQLSILHGKSPGSLRKIADQAGIDSSVSIREQSRLPLDAGLTVHSVAVQSDSIPYPELSRFLQLAEINHPPWRLVSCTLKASSRSVNACQASLLFEALDYGSQNTDK